MEIPTCATFTKDFNIHQEIPVKGLPKVIVFLTLFTTLKLSMIKFENEVYMYLRKHKSYVKPNGVVSPGILMKLYPVYTQRDDLEKEITQLLSSCHIPDTEVCNIWLNEHTPSNKKNQPNPVPTFKFALSDINWGV
eukprot:9899207-Ditylum_brightwellii.AAC.1